MSIEYPKSSKLDSDYKMEGNMQEAKISFYELAKTRIKYVDSDTYRKYFLRLTRSSKIIPKTACSVYCLKNEIQEDSYERYLENLEILINKNDFRIDDVSYDDVIPFVVEHELYEGWLSVKRGFLGKNESIELRKIRHQLALRKEFFLAEAAGLSEKLFELHIKLHPESKAECENALKYAKRKLKTPM